MESIEKLDVVVVIKGRKVTQSVDLCRRGDTPSIWIRINRPDLPPVRRSLRTSAVAEARERARLIVQKLYDNDREWTPIGPGPKPAPKLPLPTILEYADAFREWYPRDSTGGSYSLNLLKVATLAGLDPAVATLEDLDDTTVYRFLERSETDESSKRSALLCARAALSKRHRRFHFRYQMPPNLDSFRSADLPRRRLPEYHSIPDEAMERIIAEAEKLPPDLYRCHILLRELGLRTSEALAARVDWVDKQRGEWFFHLKADEFFTGKNDRALRRLPIAADIAAVLMASPGPHIVEADSETDRIDLVKRRHVSWLRAHIPDIPSQFANIRRPNQALRRAFVDRCIVELRWDIKTTANYTRHDPKTLLDWYASGRMTAPPSRIPKP